MQLVRFNRHGNRPFMATGSNILQDFETLLNEFAAPVYKTTEAAEVHPIDFYETDNELVLEMGVPGLKAENLEIGIEGKQLTIKASVKEESEESDQEKHYWAKSIVRSEFSKSLQLPSNVDVDNIDATVDHGILKVLMPKVPEAKVRKISVKSGSQEPNN